MHKEGRQPHPQGRKKAQLSEERNPGDREGEKSDDRGDDGHGGNGPYLSGDRPSLRLKGAIEEDDIGHSMVHGDTDKGAAKAHGYGKDGFLGEGVDKNGQHGSGYGRNKGQDSQPGPPKTQKRQGDQADRNQGKGLGCIPFDDSLVVQGSPEGAGIHHLERSIS